VPGADGPCVATIGMWEERWSYSYYAELVSNVLGSLLQLAHYLHVWSLHGVSFSLVDALLFMKVWWPAVSFVVVVVVNNGYWFVAIALLLCCCWCCC